MSKLMIAMPSDKTPPLYDFFNDELNEKQRQKLLSLFALMLQAPVSVMREPYLKTWWIWRQRRRVVTYRGEVHPHESERRYLRQFRCGRP
ncbi:hypothetical protein [Flavonifractor plautii]|uniref:hypothetical protein n=1 Tax=Flavonifractor plautii TaxID=292800 RepID=UPI00189EA58D|nr:hypothetical protein [Flavonifractor plautii]